jgi:hypothetical protein
VSTKNIRAANVRTLCLWSKIASDSAKKKKTALPSNQKRSATTTSSYAATAILRTAKRALVRLPLPDYNLLTERFEEHGTHVPRTEFPRLPSTHAVAEQGSSFRLREAGFFARSTYHAAVNVRASLGRRHKILAVDVRTLYTAPDGRAPTLNVMWDRTCPANLFHHE